MTLTLTAKQQSWLIDLLAREIEDLENDHDEEDGDGDKDRIQWLTETHDTLLADRLAVIGG